MSEELPKSVDLRHGLRWLVCPVCRADLRVAGSGVECQSCGRCYPVVDGIAVLLEARAVPRSAE